MLAIGTFEHSSNHVAFLIELLLAHRADPSCRGGSARRTAMRATVDFDQLVALAGKNHRVYPLPHCKGGVAQRTWSAGRVHQAGRFCVVRRSSRGEAVSPTLYENAQQPDDDPRHEQDDEKLNRLPPCFFARGSGGKQLRAIPRARLPSKLGRSPQGAPSRAKSLPPEHSGAPAPAFELRRGRS